MESIEFDTPYLELLKKIINDKSINSISFFEIEDKGFADAFNRFASSNKIEIKEILLQCFCKRNNLRNFEESLFEWFSIK